MSVKNIFFAKCVSYFSIAIAAILIPALLALRADAEVAVFITDNHLEEEIISDAISEDGVKLIQRDKRWSNFEGSVPEGAVVNTIVLRVSWSEDVVTTEENSAFDTTAAILEPSYATNTDTVIEDVQSVDPEGGSTGASDDVTIPTETEVIPQAADSVLEDVVAPETTDEVNDVQEEVVETPVVEEVVVPEPAPTESDVFEPVSMLTTYPFANASVAEVDAEGIVSTPDPVVANDEEQAVLPVDEVIVDEDPVLLLDNISVTDIESEAAVYETVAGADTPQVIDTILHGETQSSIEEDVATTTLIADPLPLKEGMLAFRYTIDGVTWHDLGAQEYATVTDAVFTLSGVSVEAIPQLQVSAQYVVPLGSDFRLYFKEIRIEAEYTVLLEEVTGPEHLIDHEPNFAMSAVKSDVSSENIRAVVIEQGGMFEFWYSVTQLSSGEVVWNKILGGGPIDENAPIAITERTIFWIDRNQQTLYGFGVDKGSLFGVSFQDPENKVFLLPFEGKRGKQWEAVFYGGENIFEFHKVEDES